jgi:hypothetical protein
VITPSLLTQALPKWITDAMKQFTVLLCAALLSGCVGTHPKGTARFDDYDSVKVEQMVGNNVSQAVFAKSIVCLNARRETRRVTGLTNTMVTAVTNQTVSAVTNQTISFSTNLLYTSMTNLAASLPPPPMPTGDAAAAGAETNLVIVASSPAASSSTNVTTSLASNSSGSRAPNQNTANSQVIRTLNQQLTTTTNNLSIALMTNLVFTGETNLIVSYVTNTALVSVTNTVITPTNGVAYDSTPSSFRRPTSPRNSRASRSCCWWMAFATAAPSASRAPPLCRARVTPPRSTACRPK